MAPLPSARAGIRAAPPCACILSRALHCLPCARRSLHVHQHPAAPGLLCSPGDLERLQQIVTDPRPVEEKQQEVLQVRLFGHLGRLQQAVNRGDGCQGRKKAMMEGCRRPPKAGQDHQHGLVRERHVLNRTELGLIQGLQVHGGEPFAPLAVPMHAGGGAPGG